MSNSDTLRLVEFMLKLFLVQPTQMSGRHTSHGLEEKVDAIWLVHWKRTENL